MKGKRAGQWAIGMAVGMGLMTLAAPGVAQEYPSRPVSLIVWTAPGGTIDMLSRMIAEKLSQRWGQPVIVENKPGASGIPASDHVAHAPADGHTLLVTITTTHVNNPLLRAKLPYDAQRDFEPVSQLATGSVTLIAPASYSSDNVAGLVTMAKRSGKTVSYGSWGIGSSAHLFGQLLAQKTGVDMNHIVYKGEMPAIADMLGGHLDVTFAGGGTARTQLAGGKIKVLGITGPRRIRALPDVPTFAEQGLAGFELAGWVGVFAPAKTSAALVKKISTALAEVVATPDIQARMIDNGFEPVGSTPEAFATLYRSEYPQWAVLIKASGAEVQ